MLTESVVSYTGTCDSPGHLDEDGASTRGSISSAMALELEETKFLLFFTFAMFCLIKKYYIHIVEYGLFIL